MADRSLSFNVAAIDRTAKSFERIALRLDKLSAKLDRLDAKRVNVDVDVDTDRALRKVENFSQVSTAATAGAVRVSTSSIYVFLGIVVAALAALPLAGAAAAAGTVLAFGAGLAGLGIAAEAHNKKVVKAFSDLKKRVGDTMRDIAKPFIPALQSIANTAGKTFGKFAGPLKSAFKDLAPTIAVFARQFGNALGKLAPAVKPLERAFSALLRQIGPQLPGIFKSISGALTDLFNTVSANPEVFAGIFTTALRAIPLVLKAVNGLAKAFVWIVDHAPLWAAAFVDAWIKVTEYFVGPLTNAVLSAVGTIIHAAATAFGWIPGLGPKLKAADKGFDTFRKNVEDNLTKAQRKAEEWRNQVNRLPKIIKVKGDIRDLEGKLRTAKQKLKDPTLTKAQRKKIQGDISDLEAKLRAARKKLRELNGTTATVYVDVRERLIGNALHGTSEHGIRAGGGPVTRGRSYLVGERGPEMFTPDSSGHITPNDQLGGGNVEVRVFIGDQELRGMVRTEIRSADGVKKQRTLAGSGRVA